jgi:neutral ceramidase
LSLSFDREKFAEGEPVKKLVSLAIVSLTLSFALFAAGEEKSLKAGAATSNITPWLGLGMAGGMNPARAEEIHDELHVRALVLDNGETRVAFVTVDSCVITREVFDEVKREASQKTGIPIDHMLMSATHTHSAPPAVSLFQNDADPEYLKFVKVRIVDSLVRAVQNLQPAQIGWGAGEVPDEVNNRRWRMKGELEPNPLGGIDRVRMNPRPADPNLLEPAGPVDPGVSVLAVRTSAGQPLAVLANYSLHYVGGVRGVSADYFGAFADRVQELLRADRQVPLFVGILTNGTSGDVNNTNFREGREPSPPYQRILKVADKVARQAVRVYHEAEYRSWVPLAALQSEVILGVRKPTPAEVELARAVVDAEGPVMKSRQAIYARETVLLAGYPSQVSLILQAVRVGDLVVAAIPAEPFAEIGLELKRRSPFPATFTVSLANGYNGYLPTAEQHRLGGYETWRARSSYLEEEAAAKITETILGLFRRLGQGTVASD